MLLGTVGLILELLLLEHIESALQWLPVAVLGCGLVIGIAVAVRPGRAALRTFQAVMAVFVGAGLLGVVLHFRSNLEFEREMDPEARGWNLLWIALHGATPALAPGALAQLGLLGLTFSFRHPALSANHT